MANTVSCDAMDDKPCLSAAFLAVHGSQGAAELVEFASNKICLDPKLLLEEGASLGSLEERHHSSYALAVSNRLEELTLDYMADEYSTAPPVAIHPVQDTIVTALPVLNESIGSMSGPVRRRSIRPYLDQALLQTLSRNDDLQMLLKEDEPLQILICGLVRMNKTNCSYFQDDPLDKTTGIRILEFLESPTVLDHTVTILWSIAFSYTCAREPVFVRSATNQEVESERLVRSRLTILDKRCTALCSKYLILPYRFQRVLLYVVGTVVDDNQGKSITLKNSIPKRVHVHVHGTGALGRPHGCSHGS
jgi:hypothetical protein